MIITPDLLNTCLIESEVDRQNKAAEKKARKSYLDNLIGQGIDSEIAKVMAKVDFEYGLVRAM